MEVYQKMKDLQMSQQNRSRMRGAQLQAMWNRICEDEEKSLARNRELLIEMDRVEQHLKRLSARTEKLCALRQQYMDYITECYPQWLASKQQSEVQGEESKIEKPEPISEVKPKPSSSKVLEPSIPIQITPPTPVMKESPRIEFGTTNYEASPTESKNDVSSNFNETPKQQKLEDVQAATVVAQAASSPPISAAYQNRIDGPKEDVIAESETDYKYAMPEINNEADEVDHKDNDDDDDDDIEESMEVPLPAEIVPLKSRSASQSPHLAEARPSGLNSPTIRKLAVREGDAELFIPTLQLGSTDGTGVTVGTGTLSDQMSELFGSVQSSKTPRIDVDAMSGSQEIHGDSERDHDLEPLTLDGFCHLLRAVAEDFSVSFNPELFYRCDTLDRASRRQLAYTANNQMSLDNFDPNAMSMVILDELPGVSRSLPGGCMVRDEVLEDISFMVKEIVFRAKLTTDGRQLWDALIEHMRQAIAHGVLSPREMALMIGPSLLAPKSPNKEKIVTVLTSLLQNQNDSQASDVSSTVTSINTSPAKSPVKASPVKTFVEESPRYSTPRDKSTSDDDFFDKSTPRYKPDFSLTGTAAYKSMMGTAHSLDDEDDEVENMLAPATKTERETDHDVDQDRSDVSAPSPVSQSDRSRDLETDSRNRIDSTAKSADSKALKSSGSGQNSNGSQHVIQRLISESEFSDTEVSLPMAGVVKRKESASEIDDFDGFFDQ